MFYLYWFSSSGEECFVELLSSREYFLGRLPDKLLRDLLESGSIVRVGGGVKAIDSSLQWSFLVNELFLYDRLGGRAYATGLYSGFRRRASRFNTLIRVLSGVVEIVDHGFDGCGSSYGTIVNGELLRASSKRVLSAWISVGERIFYIAIDYNGRPVILLDPSKPSIIPDNLIHLFRETLVLRNTRPSIYRGYQSIEFDSRRAVEVGVMSIGDKGSIFFSGSIHYKTLVYEKILRLLYEVLDTLHKAREQGDKSLLEQACTMLRYLLTIDSYRSVLEGLREVARHVRDIEALLVVAGSMSIESVVDVLDRNIRAITSIIKEASRDILA